MSGDSKAQRAVILAMFAMLSGVLYQQFKGGAGAAIQGGTYKRLWAVGTLTLILGAAADFAPQVILPFSFAVVIAFYIKNPDLLGKFTATGSATPSTGRTGQTPSTGRTGQTPSTPSTGR